MIMLAARGPPLIKVSARIVSKGKGRFASRGKKGRGPRRSVPPGTPERNERDERDEREASLPYTRCVRRRRAAGGKKAYTFLFPRLSLA